MVETPSTPQRFHSTRELLIAGGWLTLLVALGLCVAVWWARSHSGDPGVVAAVLAAGLCWVGSMLALLVRALFPRPQDAVAGTLGAMLVRMVVVMGGALFVSSASVASQRLVKAGFWELVILFFLLTLFVETVFAVRYLKNVESNRPREEAGNNAISTESRAEVN